MHSGTILVVEDHPLNLQLVRELLVSAGFDVRHAASGAAALQAARAERPDLVLLDLGLPDMDGLEVARLLKQAPDTRNLPVVALTAFAMREDAERALSQGCDGFMTKPIDPRTFVGEIAAALAAGTAGGKSER
jgi:two-component system cell cycle response regulator DivK